MSSLFSIDLATILWLSPIHPPSQAFPVLLVDVYLLIHNRSQRNFPNRSAQRLDNALLDHMHLRNVDMIESLQELV